jgi:hypothetical protein
MLVLRAVVVVEAVARRTSGLSRMRMTRLSGFACCSWAIDAVMSRFCAAASRVCWDRRSNNANVLF